MGRRGLYDSVHTCFRGVCLEWIHFMHFSISSNIFELRNERDWRNSCISLWVNGWVVGGIGQGLVKMDGYGIGSGGWDGIALDNH